MFTGIIEEQGTIAAIHKAGKSFQLAIACKKVLEGTKTGDSIAVNGVCLTVTSIKGDVYTADVMVESVRRSSLGSLKKGDTVNLERAMAADGRFGGHIVSGHIDGTGTIIKITPEENALWYTVSAKDSLLRYIVEKGSIAMDGMSLTVASVDETSFQVSIIPHTREVTNLSSKKVGDIVNLECDIVGKYIEKLMKPKQEEKHGITKEFLLEHGF